MPARSQVDQVTESGASIERATASIEPLYLHLKIL